MHLFLIIILLFKFSIVESELPIVFNTSPNITVGEKAVFNCYNEVFLPSMWYINGETLDHPSNADRSDITVIGEGTNTTLIIDGLIENDGTTVQCVVSGLVDGIAQHNSSAIHTLYIIAFSTVPTTQHVWIDQTATFKCATNYKCYTLKFSSSNDVSLIQQGDQQGGTTSTASFIVTADNNGTSVDCTCIAYSGSTPLHTSPAYGYAQGPPSSVVDLTAEQQNQCSLSVQWKAPYLLPGLTVLYNVTIINGEKINDITDSTHYTSHYCFDGDYCVNVVAFNGTIVGEPIATLMYSRDPILAEKDISVEKKDKYWMYQFNVAIDIKLCPGSTFSTVIIHSCDDIVCYTASTKCGNGTVTSTNGTTIITSNMTLPDDQYYNTNITIIDANDFNLTTDTFTTSTHDIQSITIISDGSSNGTVCIQCNYINGADSTGCIVSLSNTNITVYNILYNNEYGCVEVIAGFYSMYIFEVNNDGTIVEVENIVPDTITIEFSILSTTSYITNSIIPTMPINTNGELLYIVLPIVALLGLTILVIIGASAYCYKRSRSTRVFQIVPKNQETSPSPVKLQRSDTIETKNNNDASKQQSVFSLSNNSTSANPDNISLQLVCDESDKPHDDEDLPKEHLKSSLSNLSTLLRSQSATSSVHITDDTNVTSPSLTTMTSDFNSDTSNDTTRSSSATTASSADGEDIPLLKSHFKSSTNSYIEISCDKLMALTGAELQSRWREVGQQLGIDEAVLCDISTSTGDTEARLEKVFIAWERNSTKPYEWETVIKIAKDISEHEVAEKVERCCLLMKGYSKAAVKLPVKKSSMCSTSTLYEKPYPKLQCSDLMSLMGRKLAPKWHKIGQELGINVVVLRKMAIGQTSYTCLKEVFLIWEQDKSRHKDKPYTWETVMNILSSNAKQFGLQDDFINEIRQKLLNR